MNSQDQAVVAFLSRYPPSVQAVGLELRREVLSTIPGVLEMLDGPGKVVGYGFGAGYADLICTIIPSRSEVKLGIVGGAQLEDPNGLLQGSGKRHRYVVLASVADLNRPGLKPLLKAAVAVWNAKSGPAATPPPRPAAARPRQGSPKARRRRGSIPRR
jgi:hypothetical protein